MKMHFSAEKYAAFLGISRVDSEVLCFGLVGLFLGSHPSYHKAG